MRILDLSHVADRSHEREEGKPAHNPINPEHRIQKRRTWGCERGRLYWRREGQGHRACICDPTHPTELLGKWSEQEEQTEEKKHPSPWPPFLLPPANSERERMKEKNNPQTAPLRSEDRRRCSEERFIFVFWNLRLRLWKVFINLNIFPSYV